MVEMHAFLAVCRLHSFKGAAQELCVSQAAVSKAVQRLEAHLGGVRLFDRNSAGAVLTQRGAELRKLTQRHVLALELAFENFANAMQSRPVRISVIPTLGIQWFLPRLPHWRQLHPETDIEMRQFRHDEDFIRDDVDFWIEVKRPHRKWPEHVQTRYLLGRELVPVCAPALKAQFRRPQDLLSATLLGHTNFPDNWATWFDAAGVPSKPRLGPSFDLTMNLIVAAKSGMGVAVVPACLVELELFKGELVKPFDLEVSCGRGYYLCAKKDSPDFAAGERFTDWLVAQTQNTAFSPTA
jgi:DNA-binding transcriptional LysR family regulator